MTVLDVRKCNVRMEYEGDLSFETAAEREWLDIPYVEFSSPVKAELRYEIAEDDSVVVTGRVTFSLKGLCSRCLAELEQTFSGEVDACFVPGDGDGEEYGYKNGVVDFGECLRDAVLFALPSRLVCEGECKLPEWK